MAGDARALYNLLSQLLKPSTEKEQSRLAREVVDEAFEGLSGLVALLEAIQVHLSNTNHASSASPLLVARSGSTELEADLELLTAELPIVIALPVLLRAYLPGPGGLGERGVPAVVGMAEGEYRKSCLSGFGRAEECGIAVGQRVLDVLRADRERERAQDGEPLLRWLERELRLAREERGEEGAVEVRGH